MKKLFEKLEKYSIKDAIKIEESDRQFIALKKLSEKIKENYSLNSPKIGENIWVYLWLIIANALICYQLSWKWEDYREEFWKYFSENFCDKKNFISEFKKFFRQTKNNKRFIDTKIWRIEKLENSDFFEKFFDKKNKWEKNLNKKNSWPKFFYKNMEILRDNLAKIMNQKKDAKTIVFAVKMFWYWARNIFDFEKYPEEIKIPIDSRLENLFEKYWEKYLKLWKNSKIFYEELSKKLNIPELHLDAILWVNYEELMK